MEESMNILNCFKVVSDLDLLGEGDWIADEQNNVDVSFVRTGWNCFDESALEMLLKLSDLSEGFNVMYNLSALTIGNEKCDTYLKTLYALGYQKAVRIDCENDLRFCSDFVAGLIAQYVGDQGNIDVIITGKQSADGENGQTPFLLAEQLGWPHIGQVTMIEPVDETCLKVRTVTDEGEVTQTIKIPCILSVGNAPNSYLRVPTLKDRLRLGKQPIEVRKVENQGAAGQGLLKLRAIDYRRAGIIIEGDSPEEKAAVLFRQYLKERL